MTNAAIAAKEIRTRLKAAGIKARVRSENYSGGNAVNVDLNDETPAVLKRAQEIAEPFQYGHFDGMTDTYHISNDRKDLPAQARHVFVSNHISREMAQRVWSFIREHFADAVGAPESLDDARKANIRVMDQWVDQIVWREFHREDSEFWAPRPAAEPVTRYGCPMGHTEGIQESFRCWVWFPVDPKTGETDTSHGKEEFDEESFESNGNYFCPTCDEHFEKLTEVKS